MREASPPEPSTDIEPILPAKEVPQSTLTPLLADQRQRWQLGKLLPVEEYLAQQPDLRANPGRVLDLIYHEVLLREEAGEAPQLDEYLRRFPEFPSQLRLHFEVHRALEEASADPEMPQRTSPPGPDTSAAPAEHLSIPGYEVLGTLGRGGMGVVYKARQVSLDRVVALKMILAGPHAGTEELTRFRREAEVVARLQYPHIVQVFDVGEHDGHSYLALEYVGGGTLAQKLAGIPQPPQEAARLVELLAQAVQHAHACRVLHRDLKPANVLLTADGVPKVTDFGLAKRLDAEASQTQSGALLGTPSYMAPEQASGKTKEVGPATDVWALGAVLYECLTGRPPFRGETVLDTLEQVRRHEPVPPSRLQPKVPRDLETVCLKCLEKKPGTRYATAGELADELRRFLVGEPVRARPIRTWQRAWKWARRRPAAAGLVVVSSLAIAVLLTTLAVSNAIIRQQKERAEANLELAQEAVNRFHLAVSEELLLKEPGMQPLRRKLLEMARAYYTKFVEQKSDDLKVKAGLATASSRLARLTGEIGSPSDALATYRVALAMFEDLTRREPQVLKHRLAVADCQYSLALLYHQLGQNVEAVAASDQAIAVCEALLQESRENPVYQDALASVLNNLGEFHRQRNQLEAAFAAHQKALALRQELVRKEPHIQDHHEQLAGSLNGVGYLHELQHRREPAEQHFRQAEQHFRQAVAIREKLVNDAPEDARYRRGLSASYTHLANLLYNDSGRKQHAEAAYKKAVDHIRDLADRNPAVTEYQRQLAQTYSNLGESYRVSKQAVKAKEVHETARKIREKLAANYPASVHFALDLGASYSSFARLALDQEQLEQADEYFQRSIQSLEAVEGPNPRHPDARHFLLNTYFWRGESRYQRQRYAEALPDLQRALDLDDGSTGAFLRSQVAATLAHLGDHMRAATEIETAMAKEPANGLVRYNGACVYAVASQVVREKVALPPAEREQVAERYASRSVELLWKAHAANYFQDPKHHMDLQTDQDLDPLRLRDDFKKLLAKLSEK